MPPARCAAGLLTWNGERDAPAAARSLLAQDEPGLELLWLDNASADGTVRAVRDGATGFPAPRIAETNTGFCGGHNRLFALSQAPYYLALNQDAALAPDYIRRLCDWMDEDPALALASGLILEGSPEDAGPARIYSAGMAMGRGRFPFELEQGRPWERKPAQRRSVPAVTGAAILIRRSAALALDPEQGRLFPESFFAYFEEVDMALRAARAGFSAGVDRGAIAWHAARGQGGEGRPAIRFHYLKNHWLVSLRNDAWSDLIAELPALLAGEVRHYLPQYLRAPGVTLRAFAAALRLLPEARRSRRAFAAAFPGEREGRQRFHEASRRELAAGSRGTPPPEANRKSGS